MAIAVAAVTAISHFCSFMKTFVVALFSLAFSWLTTASAEDFVHANQLSADAAYDQADAAYAALEKQQGLSAALLYNRGTNAFAQKHWGEAILYFEQARLLSPRDRDLLKNLRLARKEAQVDDVVLLGKNVAPVATLFSRDEWSVIIVVFAWAAALLTVAMTILRKKTRSIRAWLLSGLALSFVLITLATIVLKLRRDEDRLAVVVAKDASLLLSPFAAADSITATAEGSMVMIEQSRDDFHYVHIPGTELKGWLAADQLQRVVP